ncbi:Os09g0339200 [Oryza sativa Japonica Group]|uniref:Os09g0339200 protein n=1 Tax=Oryza sativa subsp. japonica TaxID=39947 RepID=Q0J2I3_ORYSJ|nr:Os09g0339200 [Oryza sativa Japonica Group]|eukprot:NP_001062918.2 Os09g0339200 [Oryza sativa Japonica Group]
MSTRLGLVALLLLGVMLAPHARDDHLKLKAKKDKAEMINYDALPKLKAKKDKPYKGRSCANAGSEKCVQG